MKKSSKTRGVVIKTFIIIAVVMMLISVIPSQVEINEKNKNNRKVIYCYKSRIGS